MRLVRIEAGRFGKIDGRALGDLGPGLTVVHGPNEAGKSSLTALVRHVLYGFPTPASSEAPYMSDSGKRQGRLVFADPDGEWVVERIEGPHGGPVTVRALSGGPREGLVAELTAGVSRLAYRVVLGFGLGEMQQIAEFKGKDDDLLARLYAAGAGLKVSPIDVRVKLTASADTLWAKRATTAELNVARTRRDALRVQIRALESETDTLRADGARLERLERDAEAARSKRTETRLRAERVSRALAEAERLLGEAASLRADAERLDREAAAARAETAAKPVDQTALIAAGKVDALAVELSGFREHLTSLAGEEVRLAAAEAHLRTALGDAGWTEERALAAAADAGVAAEIDAAREALTKARGRAEAATEARDRFRSESGDVGGATGAPARPWLVPGAAVAVLGLVGLVVGSVLSQTVFAAFAGVLVVAGAVLAAFPGNRGVAGVPGASDRSGRGAAVESEYAAAVGALAAQTATWSEWVRSRGLGDGGEDPIAISVRYQSARSARIADGERSAARQSVTRERERAEIYARSVRQEIAPLLGEAGDSVTLERVPEIVNRAIERVRDARQAESVRAEGLQRADRATKDATTARGAAAAAAQAAAAGLVEIGLAPDGLEQARSVAIESDDAAAFAQDEADRLAQEAAALRTALGAERRDGELAELRLEEETLGERLANGVREYAVLAVAARLLTLAQERYERDRQPEVVKHAEAAFASMTNGRYRRIAVPLGDQSIEVFDASAAATAPGRLSRGTAEQLYLALRLGLIEQLGDAGRGLPVLMDDILVDFSPDRLEPAIRAIADLATRRQVVFLTCHPATADLLCSVDPDAVRLELARAI